MPTAQELLDTFLDTLYPESQPRLPVTTANGSSPMRAAAYAHAAYAGELAILEATPEGGRNVQLNTSALKLATLVAAGHLPYAQTWDALEAMALRVGLTARETRATLRSAFDKGLANPRVIPQREPLEEASVLEPVAIAGLGEQFPVVDWKELWDLPDEQEWLLEPLFPERRLIALFSPPKTGKSLLMLEVAVALSRGEKVLGSQPASAHRVLYVDFENDPRGDIVSRLKAMGHTPDDLDGLFYLSFPGLPHLDTAMGGNTLLAVVQHYGCDVVVIDTIGRVISGMENDNDTWLAFYRHTGVALKREKVTTIRLDHTGKDLTKGMRGGSAKYGDVDVVWYLSGTESQLRLECTAHRQTMPVADLMLARESDPLRHTLSGTGIAAVLAQQGQMRAVDVIKMLDEVYGEDMLLKDPQKYPGCVSGNVAKKMLRNAKVTGKAEWLNEVIRLRNERIESAGLDFQRGDSQ